MRRRTAVLSALLVLGCAVATALLDADQSTAIAVKTVDGREIKGAAVNEDAFSIHIRDDAGEIHVFDKGTRTAYVLPVAGISFERLVNSHAEPHNWPMYWGDYQGTHYSALTQIDRQHRGAIAGGVDTADAWRRSARGHADRD